MTTKTEGLQAQQKFHLRETEDQAVCRMKRAQSQIDLAQEFSRIRVPF